MGALDPLRFQFVYGQFGADMGDSQKICRATCCDVPVFGHLPICWIGFPGRTFALIWFTSNDIVVSFFFFWLACVFLPSFLSFLLSFFLSLFVCLFVC